MIYQGLQLGENIIRVRGACFTNYISNIPNAGYISAVLKPHGLGVITEIFIFERNQIALGRNQHTVVRNHLANSLNDSDYFVVLLIDSIENLLSLALNVTAILSLLTAILCT